MRILQYRTKGKQRTIKIETLLATEEYELRNSHEALHQSRPSK